MMPIRLAITLPDWSAAWLEDHSQPLPDATTRMRAAVALAEANVRYGTGGPFGALVIGGDSGEIIAIGVNRVVPGHCSSAHAEIVALSLAQQRLGHWNLAETDAAPVQLVTSCEPCAMCLGAIPWSGVQSVVCGATKADAQRAGFDEGERPDDWGGVLERRGIRVATGVLRSQATAVFDAYGKSGGLVYSP